MNTNRELGQYDRPRQGERRVVDGEMLEFGGFLAPGDEICERWVTAADRCNGREVVCLGLPWVRLVEGNA